MTRHPHWDAKLAEFLHARARVPFAWGGNDCCLFAADAIESMTGVDIAAEFRGAYTTGREAFAAILRITGAPGAEAALAWVAARHGLPELEGPLFAQRGDLLLVEHGGPRPIAGIMGLHGAPVCVGDAGLLEMPLDAVRKAWRV